MTSKPGWKTSEFWISALGMVSGVVMSSMPSNPYTQIVGAILSAVCGSSYTLGRSHTKGRQSSTASQIQAIMEDVKRRKS